MREVDMLGLCEFFLTTEHTDYTEVFGLISDRQTTGREAYPTFRM